VSSNPGTVYWMDVSDALHKTHENNENKGSRMGHTKKIFKKKGMQVSTVKKRERTNYSYHDRGILTLGLVRLG
jgi:hypothetical protein